MKSRLGDELVSHGALKSLPAMMSLPKNTSPVSRFVTIKSRLFTSLMPTAGFPGGSVHTKVARKACACAGVVSEKNRVWRCPVARALVAPWSNTNIDDLALVFMFDNTPGKLFGRLIKPQP